MFGGGNSIGGGVSSAKGKYPVEDRSCTDVIFCLVFLAFWVFSTIGVVYGVSNGNLENIAQPYDDVGNACGVPGPTLEFNYLFVTSPNSLDLTKRHNLCVKGCPKSEDEKVLCYPNKNVTDCSQVKAYACSNIVEFCIPSAKDFIQGFNEKLKGIGSETAVEDISNSWDLFLICLVCAFVISAIYCYMLEYCAGLIITTLILTLFGGLIFLGFLLRKEYRQLDASERPSTDNKQVYYYGHILCWVLAGVLAVAVCCMFSRISLAIKIIQATADFITDYQTVLLVPILNIVLFVGYLSYWVYGGAHLWSTGKTEFVQGRPYGRVIWDSKTEMFWWTHLFALFWNVSFIMYLSNFVIGFVAVSWYFSEDKHDIGSPLTRGYLLGLTRHIGSVAFGSLILAVIWMVQTALAYLQQQVQQTGEADNSFVKLFIRMAQCLVACFERVVKFVSKHAFIEIAIRSTNFCGGAATAMSLIVSNMLRLGVLHGLCAIVISFGTIAITTVTVIIGWLFLRNVEYFDTKVTQDASPLIVIGIIGYFVSKLFGHVFDISSDAMIHCFLTEENESGMAGQKSEKLSKVIEDAKEKHGTLLEYEPAPGYNLSKGAGSNKGGIKEVEYR